jgi:hypothetical protein
MAFFEISFVTNPNQIAVSYCIGRVENYIEGGVHGFFRKFFCRRFEPNCSQLLYRVS